MIFFGGQWWKLCHHSYEPSTDQKETFSCACNSKWKRLQIQSRPWPQANNMKKSIMLSMRPDKYLLLQWLSVAPPPPPVALLRFRNSSCCCAHEYYYTPTTGAPASVSMDGWMVFFFFLFSLISFPWWWNLKRRRRSGNVKRKEDPGMSDYNKNEKK
jgi:hypothetical protein